MRTAKLGVISCKNGTMSKHEEQALLENVVARVRKKLKGGCSDEKVWILIVFEGFSGTSWTLIHFMLLVSFYTPWNFWCFLISWFSDVFRGYRKRLVAWNELISFKGILILPILMWRIFQISENSRRCRSVNLKDIT